MSKETEIEHVVLVDEDNNEIGTMPKAEVHTADTPLHRAFSAFLFNDKGQFLTQQRSSKKVTWPLMWSNSVCGHPQPGEATIDAVKRRAEFELGLTLASIKEVAPYRYRFERHGVVENEICPIFVGVVANEPAPNPNEVEAIAWHTWEDFLAELKNNPDDWSEWCREETQILAEQGLLNDVLKR